MKINIWFLELWELKVPILRKAPKRNPYDQLEIWVALLLAYDHCHLHLKDEIPKSHRGYLTVLCQPA